MREPVIEASSLSKRYNLGEVASGLSLRELAGRIGRRAEDEAPPVVWALRDVSFAVEEGRCFGIVGPNGSGKSTLLKILTRITAPTSGHARVRGRVGALLEVGAGFHEELTGRENVLLAAAVLGMRRREIKDRFEEIVEFSGVRSHIDTPVKRYSSGMYLRLAFSVAVHLEPEVLIVDEALSVGDAEFQRRCHDRVMRLASEGRTILYVSHDLHSISRLCDHLMWLDLGNVRMIGDTDSVLAAYMASVSTPVGELRVAGSSPLIDLVALTVCDASGGPLTENSTVIVRTVLSVNEPVSDLDVALVIEDMDGASVVVEPTREVDPSFGREPGDYELVLTVPPVVAAGQYSAALWVWSDSGEISSISASLRFDIEGDVRRERRLVRLSKLRMRRLRGGATGCG